jgi:peptidyl-prolyl cis-trans isomerase C
MQKITITRTLLGAVVGFGVLFSAAPQAADPVAKVNGTAIPQSRMDAMLKTAAAQGQPESPELRNRVRDELITREILLQEAAKKGIEKTPEVVNQLEIQRQSLIIQAFLNDHVKSNPIPEETLRKEYENAKAAAGSKEYKARHILVKDEAEAKQIIAQLKKAPASFEKIAAEKSEDAGSKNRGGDLDWGAPARYVKPFGDALVKLKKGQITDPPVQSQFGWHIIRLDDERATKLPPFEDVKGNIQQQMQQQVVQKLITDLRAKAKIE